MQHYLTQNSPPHSLFLSWPVCLALSISLPSPSTFRIIQYSFIFISYKFWCLSFLFLFTRFLWTKFHIHHCLQLHINLHFLSLPSTSLFVFVRLSSPQLPFVTSQTWLLLLLSLPPSLYNLPLSSHRPTVISNHITLFRSNSIMFLPSPNLFPNLFQRPCLFVTFSLPVPSFPQSYAPISPSGGLAAPQLCKAWVVGANPGYQGEWVHPYKLSSSDLASNQEFSLLSCYSSSRWHRSTRTEQTNKWTQSTRVFLQSHIHIYISTDIEMLHFFCLYIHAN